MLTLLSKNKNGTKVIGQYINFIDLENKLAELFNNNFFRVLENKRVCEVDLTLYFLEER